MGNIDSKDIHQHGKVQKDFARDASSSKKLKLDSKYSSVETSNENCKITTEEQNKDNSTADKTEDFPDPVSAAAKELAEVIILVTSTSNPLWYAAAADVFKDLQAGK